ncbi:MAG TPA: HAD-IA family hydrolase [Gemmataceae bacterium]|nr:HAD-IA family hydrolase [Gemmataceae bacterium]
MTGRLVAGSIRAVFFDAVDTLLHICPPAADVYAEAGAKLGYSLGVDIIRARFREAFRQQDAEDARHGWSTSEERECRRWQEIVYFVFQDDNANLFQHLWQHFAQPSAWQVFPEAGEVIAALSKRMPTLGLASNFDRRLHAVAAAFPELANLRIRLISSEIGWRKPSPNFFAEMARQAGCEPAQILYVGDDPANDYDGATAAGLQSLLLKPNHGLRSVRELLMI